MKTVAVTESKNGRSELLRAVKAGQGVLILDRDVPVARLEPVAAGTLVDDARLLGLERQGLIRRPRETGSALVAA
jgi:antitoxin (DNA-binding transcriptional repressor) of toxin-antitoxin stability system